MINNVLVQYKHGREVRKLIENQNSNVGGEKVMKLTCSRTLISYHIFWNLDFSYNNLFSVFESKTVFTGIGQKLLVKFQKVQFF